MFGTQQIYLFYSHYEINKMVNTGTIVMINIHK